MNLSERLEAHASAWPTVYGSDRENVALIREAAALARRVEGAPAVQWSRDSGIAAAHLRGQLVRIVREDE